MNINIREICILFPTLKIFGERRSDYDGEREREADGRRVTDREKMRETDSDRETNGRTDRQKENTRLLPYIWSILVYFSSLVTKAHNFFNSLSSPIPGTKPVLRKVKKSILLKETTYGPGPSFKHTPDQQS